MRWFASCPLGLEYLLVDELKAFGLRNVREGLAGVHAEGSLADAYRAAISSRLATRLLLPLAEFDAPDADALYEGCKTVAWGDHLTARQTLSVHASVARHPAIRDSRFAAVRVKDAVCDQFRERSGSRPSVSRSNPDVQLYLFIARNQRATVGIDLLGRPLHQRGYRSRGGAAPLKENLAAALVMRSGWLDDPEQPLVDPLCGSGTLLIEAVGMALNQAPGLLWAELIQLGWAGHSRKLFSEALEAARDAATPDRMVGTVVGRDRNERAVESCRRHALAAGVAYQTTWENRELGEAFEPFERAGTVLTNPPYGRRLGGGDEDSTALDDLYRRLGERLQTDFAGWRAGIFTEDPDRCRSFGFAPFKKYRLYNGALDCRLLLFQVPEAPPAPSEQAHMVANRIRKNLKKLRRYVEQHELEAYRVYDRDIPEYAVAVDVYGSRANVQEYAPPASVEPAVASARLNDAVAGVRLALDLTAADLVVRRRQRQRGEKQYQRRAATGRIDWVREGGYRFAVNLDDYLDTGLFLDHRETRRMVGEMSAEARVLNLYCYTGSFTVYAAGGGALESTSVDLSRTYLDWARQNLEANGLASTAHRLLREDCVRFLREGKNVFDLIVLDPPTFSTAERAEGSLDIQRDHVELLELCRSRLAPEGTLLFSTNARRFKLDEGALAGSYQITDITRSTVPPDFSRRPPHRCWRLTRTES